ncbi:MAG: hypothetical protein LBH93_02860 [Chitinispirillales bacterium]|nr:hypothetical protein [Chitinispirillales bacterium]
MYAYGIIAGGSAANEYERGYKQALPIILHRMKINDLVWAKDGDGIFRLGRITSEWYYYSSQANADNEIFNARKCEWHSVGGQDVVPQGIKDSFKQSTVASINADMAIEFSQLIYNAITKNTFYEAFLEANNLSTDDNRVREHWHEQYKRFQI